MTRPATRLFSTEAGKGAFLNGQRIDVSTTSNLAQAWSQLDFPAISGTRIPIFFSIIS